MLAHGICHLVRCGVPVGSVVPRADVAEQKCERIDREGDRAHVADAKFSRRDNRRWRGGHGQPCTLVDALLASARKSTF